MEVSVFLENDTNICALGVYHCELDAKPKSMVGIFIGTGIGARIIIDGKLYGGLNHTAGGNRAHGFRSGGAEVRLRESRVFRSAGGEAIVVQENPGAGEGWGEDDFD